MAFEILHFRYLYCIIVGEVTQESALLEGGKNAGNYLDVPYFVYRT